MGIQLAQLEIVDATAIEDMMDRIVKMLSLVKEERTSIPVLTQVIPRELLGHVNVFALLATKEITVKY